MTVHSVTIEGSVMPSDALARGERKTVAYTPDIARLIEGGFVNVIEEFTDDDEVEGDETEGGEGDEGEDGEGDEAAKAPGRNESLATWQAFFTAQGLDFPSTAGRDDLVAAWTQIEQQQAGGS